MDVAEKTRDLISRLQKLESTHSPSAFACSFGAEDMVLLDVIAKHVHQIEVFTLDTGRLPEETQALLDTIRERYSIPIRIYFPDTAAVEAWVEQNGPNGFYRSMAQRLQCCHIRKVQPLQRALAGKRSWVTGLRREQSAKELAGIAEGTDLRCGLWRRTLESLPEQAARADAVWCVRWQRSTAGVTPARGSSVARGS